MRAAGVGGSCLVLALLLGSCGGSAEPAREPAPITAELVQLRRDEALDRVEVSVHNTGSREVVVKRLALRVPGFRSAGPARKDSPVAPGLVVNLPASYGTVRCPAEGQPRVGRAVAVLRVRTGDGPARTVELELRDGGLMARIAERECTQRRLAREVRLRFGDRWHRERTSDGVTLHGTLEARLTTGEPRDVTQLAGTVIYGLQPVEPGDRPLARLTPARPTASVPVVVTAARCDGHARGETKKPYEFLVWVAAPGGEEVATTPVVSARDRAALQAVCPL